MGLQYEAHLEGFKKLNLGTCRKRATGFGFTESCYSPPVVSRNKYVSKGCELSGTVL